MGITGTGGDSPMEARFLLDKSSNCYGCSYFRSGSECDFDEECAYMDYDGLLNEGGLFGSCSDILSNDCPGVCTCDEICINGSINDYHY